VSRGHVEPAHLDDVEAVSLEHYDWPAGAHIQVLSRDGETGALTGVVALPGGYSRPAAHTAAEMELLVLGGSVQIGDDRRGPGFYQYLPPGATQEPWRADAECSLLLMARRAAPTLDAGAGAAADGRIEIDTTRLHWSVNALPGPPPGVFVKVLRHVEETGETVFLEGSVPRWDYPRIEYHDCTEEVFALEGDIWLGNSGLMTPGSYFWRPAYRTHGPFYSRTGFAAIAWVDSVVVNHYVDDPRRSEEENRAEAARAERPQNYMSGLAPTR
jgi:hypothetical protein